MITSYFIALLAQAGSLAIKVDTYLLVEILNGHSRLKRHLFLTRIEEDATCPKCEEEEGSSFQHILALERARMKYFPSEIDKWK